MPAHSTSPGPTTGAPGCVPACCEAGCVPPLPVPLGKPSPSATPGGFAASPCPAAPAAPREPWRCSCSSGHWTPPPATWLPSLAPSVGPIAQGAAGAGTAGAASSAGALARAVGASGEGSCSACCVSGTASSSWLWLELRFSLSASQCSGTPAAASPGLEPCCKLSPPVAAAPPAGGGSLKAPAGGGGPKAPVDAAHGSCWSWLATGTGGTAGNWKPSSPALPAAVLSCSCRCCCTTSPG